MKMLQKNQRRIIRIYMKSHDINAIARNQFYSSVKNPHSLLQKLPQKQQQVYDKHAITYIIQWIRNHIRCQIQPWDRQEYDCAQSCSKSQSPKYGKHPVSAPYGSKQTPQNTPKNCKQAFMYAKPDSKFQRPHPTNEEQESCPK